MRRMLRIQVASFAGVLAGRSGLRGGDSARLGLALLPSGSPSRFLRAPSSRPIARLHVRIRVLVMLPQRRQIPSRALSNLAVLIQPGAGSSDRDRRRGCPRASLVQRGHLVLHNAQVRFQLQLILLGAADLRIEQTITCVCSAFSCRCCAVHLIGQASVVLRSGKSATLFSSAPALFWPSPARPA